MKRTLFIVCCSVIMTACASVTPGTTEEQTLSGLKRDYDNCMARSGHDVYQCTKQMDALWQKQEDHDIDELELYGS